MVVVVVEGRGMFPSTFIILFFLVLLFSINLSKGEGKKTFPQETSPHLSVDDGPLVVVFCGIWLGDVGLSQVAAYMPFALCCSLKKKATSLRRLKIGHIHCSSFTKNILLYVL